MGLTPYDSLESNYHGNHHYRDELCEDSRAQYWVITKMNVVYFYL